MKIEIKTVCQAALLTALVFIVTRFIQIPIPLGYFNIGNSLILIGCVLLPSPYGIIAGSLGSALADLTSYAEYTLPTLVIKAIMPYLFYLLSRKLPIQKELLNRSVACAIVTLIPLFGYTLTGGFFEGSILAGLAQFPGLFLEYVANLIIFVALLAAVRKINLKR